MYNKNPLSVWAELDLNFTYADEAGTLITILVLLLDPQYVPKTSPIGIENYALENLQCLLSQPEN